MTFDGWKQAGEQLCRVVESAAWCLGDWLVYGQEWYADRYRTTVAAVGLDYQTLRNYAWVARRFEHARRRTELSFQHHAEVAALPAADQDRLLDRAARLGWSKSMLRKHVRGIRVGATAPEPMDSVTQRLNVSMARIERWRMAAEQARTRLDEWMVNALDSAASEALGQDSDTEPAGTGDLADAAR